LSETWFSLERGDFFYCGLIASSICLVSSVSQSSFRSCLVTRLKADDCLSRSPFLSLWKVLSETTPLSISIFGVSVVIVIVADYCYSMRQIKKQCIHASPISFTCAISLGRWSASLSARERVVGRRDYVNERFACRMDFSKWHSNYSRFLL